MTVIMPDISGKACRTTIMTVEEVCEDPATKAALEKIERSLYLDTKFEFLTRMASSSKGAIFEKYAISALKKLGYKVTKRKNKSTGHDCTVGNLKIEVKGSMLWSDGIQFSFQQIRPSQDYDMIIFVAVFPTGIEFWAGTKTEINKIILQRDENGHYKHNQHGGKKVNSGAFRLDGFPEDYTCMRPLEEVMNEMMTA